LIAIHCNAVADTDWPQWKQSNAGAVVWSPFSNLWLYGVTTNILAGSPPKLFFYGEAVTQHDGKEPTSFNHYIHIYYDLQVDGMDYISPFHDLYSIPVQLIPSFNNPGSSTSGGRSAKIPSGPGTTKGAHLRGRTVQALHKEALAQHPRRPPHHFKLLRLTRPHLVPFPFLVPPLRLFHLLNLFRLSLSGPPPSPVILARFRQNSSSVRAIRQIPRRLTPVPAPPFSIIHLSLSCVSGATAIPPPFCASTPGISVGSRSPLNLPLLPSLA